MKVAQLITICVVTAAAAPLQSPSSLKSPESPMSTSMVSNMDHIRGSHHGLVRRAPPVQVARTWAQWLNGFNPLANAADDGIDIAKGAVDAGSKVKAHIVINEVQPAVQQVAKGKPMIDVLTGAGLVTAGVGVGTGVAVVGSRAMGPKPAAPPTAGVAAGPAGSS